MLVLFAVLVRTRILAKVLVHHTVGWPFGEEFEFEFPSSHVLFKRTMQAYVKTLYER